MKKKFRTKGPNDFSTDLTQDSETGEYGLIIWLGTANNDEADRLAEQISVVWTDDREPQVPQ
jgi:hypothetical protein